MIGGHCVTVEMDVARSGVIVSVQMPPLTQQPETEMTSQADQHHADGELRRLSERFRDLDTKEQDDGAHTEEYHRMSHPPTESHQARGTPRGPLSEDGRDGREMIRIQGVPKTQHEPEAQDGEIVSVQHQRRRRSEPQERGTGIVFGPKTNAFDLRCWRAGDLWLSAAGVHFKMRIFPQPLDPDQAAFA